jgi:hypothetical protein
LLDGKVKRFFYEGVLAFDPRETFVRN